MTSWLIRENHERFDPLKSIVLCYFLRSGSIISLGISCVVIKFH
jgi:hypothetical protein